MTDESDLENRPIVIVSDHFLHVAARHDARPELQ